MSTNGEVRERMSVVSSHRQLLGVLNHGFLALKGQVSYCLVNGNQALWLKVGAKKRKFIFPKHLQSARSFSPFSNLAVLLY